MCDRVPSAHSAHIMPASTLAAEQSPLPYLPDEIWLRVLAHLNWPSLWQMRTVHPKLRVEAEKLATSNLLPIISLAVTYTLGSGTRHRWYDVRATLSFSFESINKHNPHFALFKVATVHPPNFSDRALEKWRPMCARGLDPALEWQINLDRDVYITTLNKLVATEDGSLWCDWRDLLTALIRKQVSRKGRLGESGDG